MPPLTKKRYRLVDCDQWKVIHPAIFAYDLEGAHKLIACMLQYSRMRYTQDTVEYEKDGAVIWHYRLEEDR